MKVKQAMAMGLAGLLSFSVASFGQRYNELNVGDLRVERHVEYVPKTQTLTNAGSITVSSAIVHVDPVAAVTNTIGLPRRSGHTLLIINTGASTTSVHIAESSTLALTATNITLGANDTLLLRSTDTNQWVQVATSNN